MLVGEDGPGGVNFNDFELAYQLGSLALAIILFSGGLDTDLKDVKKAWLPTLLLATISVCLTARITGSSPTRQEAQPSVRVPNERQLIVLVVSAYRTRPVAALPDR